MGLLQKLFGRDRHTPAPQDPQAQAYTPTPEGYDAELTPPAIPVDDDEQSRVTRPDLGPALAEEARGPVSEGSRDTDPNFTPNFGGDTSDFDL